VINRMGFNNQGQQAALARLGRRRRGGGIVGVNIGANKDSTDRIADYAAGVMAMTGVADYLTVNISSPNTPGLRALQDKGALAELLAAVMEARGAGYTTPDMEAPGLPNLRCSSRSRRTWRRRMSTTSPPWRSNGGSTP
jgi:dihydroorotate dehydrogenase